MARNVVQLGLDQSGKASTLRKRAMTLLVGSYCCRGGYEGAWGFRKVTWCLVALEVPCAAGLWNRETARVAYYGFHRACFNTMLVFLIY